ncbi:hypothetical protein ACFS5L_43505 [Streptomyces phyllanthi]|uniref:hypothetical protein n=1 Tax=Streptomyces phyllanthi TaxID=1803180 RepID=UPI001D14CD20|nr:hypothetical protein [Streptomyces phyllanthi]
MRAVWRAARAAVRRRRLQTLVIALVTLTSTAAMVVALGLVDAASAPFDKAFGEQRGPHVVAAFDPGRVSEAQLARAARQPGVEAAAGPFAQAAVELSDEAMNSASAPRSRSWAGPAPAARWTASTCGRAAGPPGPARSS